MNGFFLRHALLYASAFWLAMFSYASAASLIRDAEIEDTLRRMNTPILQAANIPPENVRIFIINDPSINAFVAGGMNIFFHTGLILKADTPEMLMGVMAHETGHISGAHLSQLRTASQDATMGALISYVLGAAALLGGSSDVGGAIMSAGQNTSMRQLLSHYRGNEQQADQAGISYLEANQISPKGMLDMFELLRRNEKQHIGANDPYLRTHPLTTDRIAAMRSAVTKSTLTNQSPSKEIQQAHARMVAKLYAFLNPFEQTMQRYPASDQSEAGYLARSVAYFRRFDRANAIKEIDQLISQSPDAYAYDMKGQILFENGDINGALLAYKEAVSQAPNNPLLLTDLGKAYVSLDQYPQAIKVLERAARQSNPSSATQRYLAIAYGRSGKIGMSNLALAKEAALQNKPDDILRYAAKAKEELTGNASALLQVEDLIADAQRLKKKEAEKDDIF